MNKLNILYEDNHIIVVVKPQNIPSQADESGDEDMLTMVKAYVKEKYEKPGEVYVGLVHRLDRPTGGIMVFARTSKAASRLSEQIRDRKMNKTYFAVCESCPKDRNGQLVHYLKKDVKENIVKVAPQFESGVRMAELEYSVLAFDEQNSLLQVRIITGRSHQIRVQLAAINCPISGDNKYGKNKTKASTNLGLWAGILEFEHPVKHDNMRFICPPNQTDAPWNKFYLDKYIKM